MICWARAKSLVLSVPWLPQQIDSRITLTTTNQLKDYFDNIPLDEITNRDLSRWVEFERKRGIQDITIRLWFRQFNKIWRTHTRQTLDAFTAIL